MAGGRPCVLACDVRFLCCFVSGYGRLVCKSSTAVLDIVVTISWRGATGFPPMAWGRGRGEGGQAAWCVVRVREKIERNAVCQAKSPGLGGACLPPSRYCGGVLRFASPGRMDNKKHPEQHKRRTRGCVTPKGRWPLWLTCRGRRTGGGGRECGRWRGLKPVFLEFKAPTS